MNIFIIDLGNNKEQISRFCYDIDRPSAETNTDVGNRLQLL